jgi:hypothetical protein
MGKFTKLHGNKGNPVILTPEIDDFLEKADYTLNTDFRGGSELGWRNVYKSKSGVFRYKVHITSRSVRTFEESDHAGCVVAIGHDHYVNSSDLESVESFINMMDEAFKFFDLQTKEG